MPSKINSKRSRTSKKRSTRNGLLNRQKEPTIETMKQKHHLRKIIKRVKIRKDRRAKNKTNLKIRRITRHRKHKQVLPGPKRPSNQLEMR